ncbi:MAG: hypothetical protein ACOCRK_10660 [bacterium]
MEDIRLIKGYKANCYHGTDKKNVKSILQNGFYHSSKEDEWLGAGVYFFEKDIFQAINWCTRAKVKEIDNPAVIEVDIKTDSLIDLTLTCHYNYLMKLSKEIHKEYRKRLRSNDLNGEKLTSKHIFNILYQIKEYSVIRHVFNVTNGGTVLGTKVARVQIQVCVRDEECISNMKEVDLNGYEELS